MFRETTLKERTNNLSPPSLTPPPKKKKKFPPNLLKNPNLDGSENIFLREHHLETLE